MNLPDVQPVAVAPDAVNTAPRRTIPQALPVVHDAQEDSLRAKEESALSANATIEQKGVKK
jgi:hypothetical protein